MLTLERVIRDMAVMPLLTRLGLLVFALGGATDVAVHLLELAASPEAAAAAGHSHAELDAHVTTFVGMVLIILGVVVDGVRQSLARRQAGRSKGVA
jgi:hypothetical protein